MTSELLARATYTLAKRRHTRRSAGPGAPVVVYSMAKTGSSAIAAALRAAGGLGPVHHVHDLDPQFLATEEREYRWSGRPWRIWDAQRLLGTPPSANRRWTVVSLVREPIAQTISAFFQPGQRRGYVHPHATTDELLERFGDRLDHLPLRWFDTHLRPALDIDVFARPFDPIHRFQIIETPTVRLLLLRTEDLAVAPVALASLLDRPEPVPVPRVNVGAEKEYAELYRRFRSSLRPTAEQLDRAYDAPVVKHFYSEGEIQRFRMLWSHEAATGDASHRITDDGAR